MKWLSIFTATLLIGSIQGFAQITKPRQIMDKAYKATRLAGAEAISTMTIIDSKGRERIRKIAQITKLTDNGKTEKKLIRFLSPADVKGTGLLTFDHDDKDDDMWLFMPALRKTRRIVSSEKSKSFMGSEFSYADINPPTLDDFTFKLLAEEDVNGETCWKIEMLPVNEDIADENGFSKRISWIAKSDNMNRKSIYYDLDDELLKELTVYEIKLLDPVNKKYRAMHLEMINVQNDRKSILKIDQIQFSPQVKDDFFTTRYLERQ
ncbi:outer membrane lipoprotein-sorting protein [bacterium]|nr:outer membrane lipoprotein-sorting protein [bacterium]